MDPVMKAQPNVKQAVPFFIVRNISESIKFYVDGLGFRMTNKWIDEGKLKWCWLELDDAAMMLQERFNDGQHDNASNDKVGEGVSICFICNDALAIYRDIRSRGIQANRPFIGNGLWVTELSDPDGFRLAFESPTDEAEDTVLSDDE